MFAMAGENTTRREEGPEIPGSDARARREEDVPEAADERKKSDDEAALLDAVGVPGRGDRDGGRR